MTIKYSGDNITFSDNSVQNTAATGFGFKNRIINGAMMIDQRNAGASVTANNVGAYCLDRYQLNFSQNSKFTVQQNAGSVTPPAGFTNYLGITSTAATSVGASDYFIFEQPIEGFNTADLGFGTSNAQTITLSFWVRSSLTGTFGGVFSNSAQNRSYPFTYTITSANTWEQKSVTIVGDTSGTWVTNNGIGLRVRFGLGAGSTYSGTAGSWQASNLFSATGATSVVGTNGATFYITGVQLEKGSTATSFDYRPYGTELALCQRYFEVGGLGMSGCVPSTLTQREMSLKFQVTKRAAPTLVGYNGTVTISQSGVGNENSASPSTAYSTLGTTGAFVSIAGFASGNAYRPCSGISENLQFSAEL